jgi:CheY-like chemotaxis protein
MESDVAILVVEDDAVARQSMKTFLEGEGYRVACVANGQEGMDYLTKLAEPPNLILLDLSMPVMDGWQFRKRQRLAPAFASIPVVLLSAESNLAHIAASLGVNGYFLKPVELDGLLEVIRLLC